MLSEFCVGLNFASNDDGPGTSPPLRASPPNFRRGVRDDCYLILEAALRGAHSLRRVPDRPIMIAGLRLLTLFPDRLLLSVLCLRPCIGRATLLDAFLQLRAIIFVFTPFLKGSCEIRSARQLPARCEHIRAKQMQKSVNAAGSAQKCGAALFPMEFPFLYAEQELPAARCRSF
jgi:hypothetical protein